MNKIWILVVNQSKAQIYASKRLSSKPLLVDELTNKEGATHPRDLVSDAPGRAFDSHGQGRHAMEPNVGVKAENTRRFVKEIVEQLRAAHLHGNFDRLVVLAAPAVLGVLRKTLGKDLKNAVIGEIPKDMIGQKADRIQAQLEQVFEVAI